MASHSVVYPELGETTTAAIRFTTSVSGGYRVNTHLELKGIGITKIGDGTHNLNGYKTYRVTFRAMEKLKENYDCCYIALL